MIGRLICFPYAGGSSLAYQPWRQRLDGIDLTTPDLPGHLMRPDERLLRSMSKLVARLIDELGEHFEPPFVLCGSSLGALVAFEVAAALETAGVAPRGLVALAAAPPVALPLHPPIAGLPDRQFLDAFTARYGGAMGQIAHDDDTTRLILPMIRADMELFEDYIGSPAGKITCPILSVAGADDPAAPMRYTDDWSRLTTATAETAVMAGGHFIVETDPDRVLDVVVPWIRRMLRGPSDGR